MTDQKKVFITGIAGFIGFHIAVALKKRGDDVIGCDNFNDYYSPHLKQERVRILEALGIEVITSDIRNIKTLSPLFTSRSITHLVHLAAQAGVRYSLTHPQTYIESNIDGLLQVLELCRSLPSLKLIFASSSSVYGNHTKAPFSETSQTDDPASLYAATKKGGELLAKTYHHLFNLSITSLRFFTVYGPWGRPDMAYFYFAKAIMEDKEIPLFNQGKMKRDFTYISDIEKGVLKAIDLCDGYHLYNLGNSESQELLVLVDLLEKSLGKKAKISLKPMQKGDVFETYADISKAKKELGFVPSVSLSEGISMFIKWFLEKGNSY